MRQREARTVLVVGAGSAGGAAALTLAAGGVERLVVVDDATVAEAELAASPGLREGDAGAPRGAATARTLARLFPAVAVEVAPAADDASAAGLARRAAVVVDASNRLPALFALNDAALAAGVPLVRVGVAALSAQLVSVVPGETACLRCLFEGPPPALSPPTVFGPLAVHAGALAGAEALRLLAGEPGAYAGRILSVEARSGRARTVPLHRRPACPACARLARRPAAEAA